MLAGTFYFLSFGMLLPAHALADASHAHAAHAVSAAGSNWDFFSNYGNYLPRTHCLLRADGTPDWPWIGVLLALNLIVIAGYLKIFLFWRQCYLAENLKDRNTKLMDLAGIFLLCATCGYAMFIVTLFWPAYRLLAILMVGLSFFTWRFALNLSDFKLTFSAKRLQRELSEHLERRNHELEHLVAERTAELERANQFKRIFVANVSHDIRTPMTAILGFAELLNDHSTTDDERNQYVATIRRNGQHMVGLLDDVLDLSKIEAGKLTIERSRCDVVELMRDAVATFDQRARDKQLKLSLCFDTPLPRYVETDALRLRQIVGNLVGNAIKFTEQGSITVRLKFVGETDGGTLTVSVHDTGCGIAAEHLNGVFDAFDQGQRFTARQHGGTGLGLTISRNLARLMGGELNVESKPGHGSTFVLTLPTGNTADVPLVAGESLADAPAVATEWPTDQPLQNLRVLVAEDARDTQMLIKYILTRCGAQVQLVDNGNAAVAAARGDTPVDLILMDMQMPELDGLAATRQLRAAGYAGPIIALTANAMASDRELCLAAGCNAYLAKPLAPHELINAVRRHVAAGVR